MKKTYLAFSGNALDLYKFEFEFGGFWYKIKRIYTKEQKTYFILKPKNKENFLWYNSFLPDVELVVQNDKPNFLEIICNETKRIKIFMFIYCLLLSFVQILILGFEFKEIFVNDLLSIEKFIPFFMIVIVSIFYKLISFISCKTIIKKIISEYKRTQEK